MLGSRTASRAGFGAFSQRLEHGLQEGQLRHRDVPRMDDGVHPGPGTGDQGQVGHRRHAGNGGNWAALPGRAEAVRSTAVAADLVEFLTSPASEAYVFKQTGNLPSQPALSKSGRGRVQEPVLQQCPGRADLRESALRLKPQIIGPQQGAIQTASSNAIQRVEQKKQSPAKSWAQFLKDVKAIT